MVREQRNNLARNCPDELIEHPSGTFYIDAYASLVDCFAFPKRTEVTERLCRAKYSVCVLAQRRH